MDGWKNPYFRFGPRVKREDDGVLISYPSSTLLDLKELLVLRAMQLGASQCGFRVVFVLVTYSTTCCCVSFYLLMLGTMAIKAVMLRLIMLLNVEKGKMRKGRLLNICLNGLTDTLILLLSSLSPIVFTMYLSLLLIAL